jgi:hypothetical protein
LVILADLGARCRSQVVPDGYKGDTIELVPEPEGPARLSAQLSQLAAGMRVMGTPDADLWRLTREAALGGVHPIKRSILSYLTTTHAAHTASVIAAKVRLKESTVRRHLEHLVALDLLERMGEHHPELWSAGKWLQERW